MQLALPAILLNTALGAGLGFAGGLLGIGGGLIAIPMLAWLYGMDQHLAQGTALVMIAPNVLIGFFRYHQKHRIDLRAVAAISVFSMIAAYVSGRVVVPALVGLFRMEQTRAQGMALALVVPSSLIALFAYAQGQHVDWGIGVPMAVGGIATVSAGVAVAHRFPAARLRILFCAVLLGTAVTMLLSTQ